MKTIADLIPTALTDAHHRRIFWNAIKAERPETTPDEARENYERVIAVLPEYERLNYYLILCYMTNVPINHDTASQFARSELERDNATTARLGNYRSLQGESNLSTRPLSKQ